MTLPSLTGAQKTQLRGRGQVAPDRVWLGKEGVTPAFLAEINRQLEAHELVKLRFTGGQDRHIRATLSEQIASDAGCLFIGGVGHTALFWRPAPGAEQDVSISTT